MRVARIFGLACLVALAILVPFALLGARTDAAFGRWLEAVRTHRPLAVALLGGLLAVDVLVPVPSSVVSTACGAVLGFWGGLLTSFAGMTISAVAGYGLGRWASARAIRWLGPREAESLRRIEARYGAGFLVAARPVPILAEASTVFAGLSRLPLPSALGAVSLGNLGVSAVYAAVGAWGRRTDAFLPAFGIALLLSGLAMAPRIRRRAT